MASFSNAWAAKEASTATKWHDRLAYYEKTLDAGSGRANVRCDTTKRPSRT